MSAYKYHTITNENYTSISGKKEHMKPIRKIQISLIFPGHYSTKSGNNIRI